MSVIIFIFMLLVTVITIASIVVFLQKRQDEKIARNRNPNDELIVKLILDVFKKRPDLITNNDGESYSLGQYDVNIRRYYHNQVPFHITPDIELTTDEFNQIYIAITTYESIIMAEATKEKKRQCEARKEALINVINYELDMQKEINNG